MQDRTCSKCNSKNVYRNTSNNWHQDGVVLQMFAEDNFRALFQTQAFLCLDCRHLDIQVSESSTMFGDQKTLADAVHASNNWIKA